MGGDRLDPRESNPVLDRARLLNQAPPAVARMWWRTLMELGLDENGLGPEQRDRLKVLHMTGDVAAARSLLARHHGPAYARHLLATGRIGEGVTL